MQPILKQTALNAPIQAWSTAVFAGSVYLRELRPASRCEIFQSKEEIALLLRCNLLFGNMVDQLDTLATWYPMWAQFVFFAPVTLRMCQDLPYNTALTRNLLNHYDQQTAVFAMEVQTLKEQDWECAHQASVLANVAQAFESDESVSDDEGDRVTLFSLATQLSLSWQGDAETLTVMLQEQLDAINEEIWLIEEEKNTEQRAKETESREGRGSLGSLPRFKSVSSLNLHPASSGASSCLPLPKPKRRRRHRPAREGDWLGIVTRKKISFKGTINLVSLHYFACIYQPSDLRKQRRKLPALQEEVGDDKTAIKCETSTPASPRSLRLDCLHTGSLCTATHRDIRDTHGDIRDAHNSTGSQDNPENNPSSSTSRQDSLHKAPKKGMKSSIGRLFCKKEKGRLEYPGRIFTPSTSWKAPVNTDN
ncbi:hypothetical protein CapIbe_021802 [Capra ibex]